MSARLVLLVAIAFLAACGREEPPPGREMAFVQQVDLFDFVGERAERERGGLATVNFPELRDELMGAEKTDAVFVTELARAVVFDGLSVPGHARLALAIRVLPAGSYGGARIGALYRARTVDGEWHSERGFLSLSAGEAWSRVEHGFALEQPIERIEVGFPTLGPAPPKARLAVLRPRLTFRASVRAQRATEKGPPRQAILVTLDTLRRDHLGCYGNERIQTPHFDAFARDGVRFDGCHSVTNGTNPGHVSIFTSLHLRDHKVRDNFARIDPSCPTMMDGLRQAGFRTAAFTSSFSFEPERCGLGARFDDYYPCQVYYERRAEDVNAELFPWLARHHDEDFFVWVHYFDAHMPYAPPAPFDRMYDTSAAPGAGQTIERSLYAVRPPSLFASERRSHYLDRYMGEISYMDACFGELVAHLRALGIYGRSQIIVVGDHGESLGENGIFFDHVGLFRTSTAVPLLVKTAAGAQRGVVDSLVSVLDVYPTLFDLLGLSIAERVRGRSLRPWIETGRGSAQETLFLEHGRGEQWALRTAGYLCTLGRVDRRFFPGFAIEDGRVRLYDVEADPDATHDLAGERPELAAELGNTLRAEAADALEFQSIEIDDPEYLERLRALGYAK